MKHAGTQVTSGEAVPLHDRIIQLCYAVNETYTPPSNSQNAPANFNSVGTSLMECGDTAGNLLHTTSALQEQWSWQAHEAELPEEDFDPEAPRALLPVRVRQRTPRLDSQVNILFVKSIILGRNLLYP